MFGVSALRVNVVPLLLETYTPPNGLVVPVFHTKQYNFEVSEGHTASLIPAQVMLLFIVDWIHVSPLS